MSQSTIEVYDREGKVVISTVDANYTFEPGDAVAFGNAMMAAAQACGVEIQVQVEQRQITAMQRNTLIVRVQHIARSMRGKKPEMIASQIVDTILAEIL